MYQLFSRKLSTQHNGKAYAWINPQGICFTSRDVLPYGWLSLTPADSYQGMSAGQLRAIGFKKQATHMTQEQLSNGWLCR